MCICAQRHIFLNNQFKNRLNGFQTSGEYKTSQKEKLKNPPREKREKQQKWECKQKILKIITNVSNLNKSK